jgi:hypothetical protein
MFGVDVGDDDDVCGIWVYNKRYGGEAKRYMVTSIGRGTWRTRGGVRI